MSSLLIARALEGCRRAFPCLLTYNSLMGRCDLKSLCALGMASFLWLTGLSGCVPEVLTVDEPEDTRMVLVVGQAVTVITGDRARRFGPEVRQIELMQRHTGKRYSVTVNADDKAFAFFLPAGEYEITRVQISEGPFLSIAQLSSFFFLGDGAVVFVGTWRFGVDSPRYGRMVLVSMIPEDDARQQAERKIREQYSALAGESPATVIPVPAETEARLYEVLPYPRYPKYFQRHLW